MDWKELLGSAWAATFFIAIMLPNWWLIGACGISAFIFIWLDTRKLSPDPDKEKL